LAQTYAQLQEQIAQLEEQSSTLQEEAATLRASELKGVIEQAIATIAEYGITVAQLGLRPNSSARERKAPLKAMYGDDKGNTWSGRGKRPNWLRNALIVGEALEQFRL
jgi:DNA-binding protein H-NS